MSPTRFSVIVPTLRRPDDLRRCLGGLSAQSRPADEVVVVHRDDDEETRRVLRDWGGRLPLRPAVVGEPGLVAAMRCGLAAADGDLIALTDDDAVPRPAWLAQIERHFNNPAVGGVGGRDVIHTAAGVLEGTAQEVGRLRPSGKLVGNHHLDPSRVLDVDLLKGVNRAFRGDLLRRIGFDARLRGRGSQASNEVILSLAVRRQGYRLIFDPAVIVDHHPAERTGGDVRLTPTPGQARDAAFNEALGILEYLPSRGRRLAFLAWALAVGHRGYPGVVQAVRFTPSRGVEAWRHTLATARGRLDAARAARPASAVAGNGRYSR